MKTILCATLFACLPLAAHAGLYDEPDFSPQAQPGGGSKVTESLTLFVGIGMSGDPVAKLGECGQIKGPFAVYAADGTLLFSIPKGEIIGPMVNCE